jgi:hypothetical protein
VFAVLLIACATLFFGPWPLVKALLALVVPAVVSRLALGPVSATGTLA